MIQIPAKQAMAELDKLFDEVAKGQDVVIISEDGSAYKLTHCHGHPNHFLGVPKEQYPFMMILTILLKDLKIICHENIARHSCLFMVYRR